MKTTSLIVIFLIALIVAPRNAFGEEVTNLYVEQYEKVTGAILQHLERTEDFLERLPNNPTPGHTETRALKSQMFLQLLNEIDSFRDPTFDMFALKNRGSTHIFPPAPYSEGIDPSAIKEPELRRQYEEALIDNHFKPVRVRFQDDIIGRYNSLEAWLTTGYFRAYYRETPADAKELVSYLEMIKDPIHKADFMKVFDEYVKLSKQPAN